MTQRQTVPASEILEVVQRIVVVALSVSRETKEKRALGTQMWEMQTVRR